MTSILNSAFFGLSAVVLLSANPAAARDGTVVFSNVGEIGAIPTAQVDYSDLDLTSKRGEAVLTQRLSQAVREVCARPSISRMPSLAESRCRDVASANAKLQMLAAIDRVHGAASLALATQVAPMQR